ncbi:MAG: hypothetical protein COV46_00950 [Deltaproteobacteria bacterium CG11_big_fil_rev_8_21_14_0_20_49_13]|nr:MAG: hypothetical protein COV46_00950 [Deltaproteobacteria bacterium CG11_big_fil_rev_8_21_14_0_20_49_13]
MRKHLILSVVCLAFVVACAGSSNRDAEMQIVDQAGLIKYPHAYVFTIMGKVVCPTCKTNSVLTIGLEDNNGTYLLGKPYTNWFGDGSYKITNVTLEAGDKILFRAYVDGIYPIGKASDLIEVPDEEGSITAPTIIIP